MVVVLAAVCTEVYLGASPPQWLTTRDGMPQCRQIIVYCRAVVNLVKHIEYWQKSAERDHDTMLVLFRIKRYSESLFFGHIILEKILKAHVVKVTRSEAPKIHNLVILAERAGIQLTKEENEFLGVVNRYNMRTRYPDVKLNFYRLCTKNYTERNLKEIEALYQKLCQRMKQNK